MSPWKKLTDWNVFVLITPKSKPANASTMQKQADEVLLWGALMKFGTRCLVFGFTPQYESKSEHDLTCAWAYFSCYPWVTLSVPSSAVTRSDAFLLHYPLALQSGI